MVKLMDGEPTGYLVWDTEPEDCSSKIVKKIS